MSAKGLKDHQLKTLFSQSWILGPFKCNRVQGPTTWNTVLPIIELWSLWAQNTFVCNRVQGPPTRITVLPIMELWSFWVQQSSRINNLKHCSPNHGVWVLLCAIWFKEHQLETLTPNHGVMFLLSAIQFKDNQLETLYTQPWSFGPFWCHRCSMITN